MTDAINTKAEINSLEDAIVKINSLQAELEKSEHERNEYRKLYELVHLELERLRRHLFGKKSERVADEQLTLQFLEIAEKLKGLEEEENAPLPNSCRRGKKGKMKRTPHGRQTLPEHLPLERIVLPIPPEVEADPDAFKNWKKELDFPGQRGRRRMELYLHISHRLVQAPRY